MNKLLLAIIFTMSFQLGHAQLKIYEFEQLDSLQQLDARPVAVFIRTDWCKFCATMENTTLKNEEVVDLLNSSYYFIDLNAESKRDIRLGARTFKYRPSGNNTGVHELAEQLGTVEGKVSYPTISVFNPDYEILFQYNAFMKASSMKRVLANLINE